MDTVQKWIETDKKDKIGIKLPQMEQKGQKKYNVLPEKCLKKHKKHRKSTGDCLWQVVSTFQREYFFYYEKHEKHGKVNERCGLQLCSRYDRPTRGAAKTPLSSPLQVFRGFFL